MKEHSIIWLTKYSTLADICFLLSAVLRDGQEMGGKEDRKVINRFCS